MSTSSAAPMSTYSGSIALNPLNSGVDINTRGTDWLWAAFALFCVLDLGVIVWSFMAPIGQRLFHHLAAVILTVTAISYFSMASDLGATSVVIEFIRNADYAGETRAIWYVRYIQFFITWPLMLLEITLASGFVLSDISTISFMSIVMVVARLVGALVPSTYKWGYFVFSLAAYFYIVISLFYTMPLAARTSIGADVRTITLRSSAILMFFWLLYPLAWGLSEGGNVITSDGEMVFYGVLDVVGAVVFLVFHLFSVAGIDHSRLLFGSTSYQTSRVSEKIETA